jgi:hypothetical protein
MGESCREAMGEYRGFREDISRFRGEGKTRNVQEGIPRINTRMHRGNTTEGDTVGVQAGVLGDIARKFVQVEYSRRAFLEHTMGKYSTEVILWETKRHLVGYRRTTTGASWDETTREYRCEDHAKTKANPEGLHELIQEKFHEGTLGFLGIQ